MATFGLATIRSTWALFGLIALLSLTIRWFAIEMSSDALKDDPDGYLRIATIWERTGTYASNYAPNDLRDSNKTEPSRDTHQTPAVSLEGPKEQLLGIPTAFRPPLYPFLIKKTALSTNSQGELSLDKRTLQLIHAVLGSVTALGASFCFLLLANLCLPTGTYKLKAAGALLCGLGISCDPILIRQSQLIMTETLATALSTTLVVMLAVRQMFLSRGSSAVTICSAISIGTIFGFNALCRPTSLAWLLCYVAMGIGLLILPKILQTLGLKKLSNGQNGNNHNPVVHGTDNNRAIETVAVIGNRRRLHFLSLLLLASFLPLVPWAIRNWKELGHCYFTTTHGGYTLLLANNHSLYDHFATSWSRDWNEKEFFDQWDIELTKVKNEIEADELANRLAKGVIVARPAEFLQSAVVRLGWLWAPWPNQGGLLAKIVVGIWYCGLYFLALVACFWLSRRYVNLVGYSDIWLPTLSLLLSISLVHSVYWSNMRMRSVAMPELMILASLGLCIVVGKANNLLGRSASQPKILD